MEQNRIATNSFNITSPAFSMLNLFAAHAHYLDIKSGKFQSVAELHDAEHARLIKDNRHYLRTVAEVLLLTAQQKIASERLEDRFALRSGYDDYRPIAILPVLSKVFENLVLQQMQEFIYNHRLLHDTQSGFRKGHSTTTALLKFKDDISKAMKKGEITLAVFADFSKAFNTVDPEVLINKLSTDELLKIVFALAD